MAVSHSAPNIAPSAYIAGTVLQVAVIATGVVVPVMYALGAIFGALWLTAIWLGRRYQVP